jgi:hypothetical protein
LKDHLEDAKKKYDEESKRKKELFEKIKNNEPTDNLDKKQSTNDGGIEIDISLSSIKNKFSTVFSKIKIQKPSTANTNEQVAKTAKEEKKEISETNEKEEKVEDLKQSADKMNEENLEKNENSQNEEKSENKKEDSKDTKQDVKEEKKQTFGRKFISGFIDVWQKTFPGEENIEGRFERRREEARILKEKIKEASEEEIQKVTIS